MTKRQSIFDDEHGPPSKEVPPKLAPLIEADAGMGVSSDPGEMIWAGGGTPFDVGLEFEQWLIEGALDAILLTIIDAYPWSADAPDHDIRKRRERLEHAKKHLLGRPAPEGAPPTNDRERLREIARRWWVAYATQAEGPSLQSIAMEVIVPNWKELGYPREDVQNLARSYVNAFKKDKDRLLLGTSAEGLPEIGEAAAKVGKIITLLSELGIVSRRVR